MPSFPRRRESRPLDSGNIQRLSESPRFWIPTFVGMTGFEIAAFIGKNRNRSAVIPAQMICCPSTQNKKQSCNILIYIVIFIYV
ncbi:hypothetical protein, partial [Neisseria meningitidis]|uniref:hypothetical protein n=1 Tax=Neisseria meningitidis TaxID=487 RepID=UPI001E297AF2